MKFAFCGDLDAPDWLLADIAILSKLSSVQLKLLAVMIMKDLTGEEPLDYEKALKRTESLEGLREVKAAVAALVFVVTHAARFAVPEQKLSLELQQLGLPKESSESMCRSYKDYRPQLAERLKMGTLKLPQIEKIKWRVDFVLCSSKLKEVSSPSVELSLRVRDPLTGKCRTEAFELSSDKMRVLHNELKQARSSMQEIVDSFK